MLLLTKSYDRRRRQRIAGSSLSYASVCITRSAESLPTPGRIYDIVRFGEALEDRGLVPPFAPITTTIDRVTSIKNQTLFVSDEYNNLQTLAAVAAMLQIDVATDCLDQVLAELEAGLRMERRDENAIHLCILVVSSPG